MSKPYRTKMEYAIYVDEQEILHLAQHIQGTRNGLVPTDLGSNLALLELNKAALHIIKILNQKGIENPIIEERISKRQLKGIMVRYSIFEGKSVCYLFVKDEELKLNAGDFFVPEIMKGVFIYHSTKKSPAYVQTSLISSVGSKDLIEKLNGKLFVFPSDGFFQINIPVVESFLKDAYAFIKGIQNVSDKTLVDLYAGVGTIGIYLGELFKKVVGVEYFTGSKEYALKNALENNLKNYEFYEVKSEDFSLEKYSSNKNFLFVDPPRAGCAPKVIEMILKTMPEYIFYLSCNPETQARDIELLKVNYSIVHLKDYDFFPKTKHLERFVILHRLVSQ